VTITGAGFNHSSTMKFNGTAAASLTPGLIERAEGDLDRRLKIKAVVSGIGRRRVLYASWGHGGVLAASHQGGHV
jgi:hypothetical protein